MPGSGGHYRRSPHSTAMKVCLASALRPVLSSMPTEQVRTRLGDAASGTLRRDLGDIKSCRPERIARLGFERLLFMCSAFQVDPYAALAAAPAGTVH